MQFPASAASVAAASSKWSQQVDPLLVIAADDFRPQGFRQRIDVRARLQLDEELVGDMAFGGPAFATVLVITTRRVAACMLVLKT